MTVLLQTEKNKVHFQAGQFPLALNLILVQTCLAVCIQQSCYMEHTLCFFKSKLIWGFSYLKNKSRGQVGIFVLAVLCSFYCFVLLSETTPQALLSNETLFIQIHGGNVIVKSL